MRKQKRWIDARTLQQDTISHYFCEKRVKRMTHNWALPVKWRQKQNTLIIWINSLTATGTLFNHMTTKDTETIQPMDIQDLENKLDDLIVLYKEVKDENHSLKTKQEELVREKAKLIEKTSLARTRVEAMITRLKSMEHGAWTTNRHPYRYKF